MVALVLGSSSPRRQKFLQELGLDFIICPPDIDEIAKKGEKPRDFVKRITRDKAAAVQQRHPGKVILTADCDVALGRRVLGKPATADVCRDMLRQLSGKRHKVIASVCVIDTAGHIHQECSETIIKMRPLTAQDINRHVDNQDNWQGAAGGFKAQMASGLSFISWLRGDYSAVVGLPLASTVKLLRRAGVDV